MNASRGGEPQPSTTTQDTTHSPEIELPEVLLPPLRPWPEAGYTPVRHIRAGLVLGALAGCSSLVANVIGAVAWTTSGGESLHPLRLIQVYLTFPFGQQALELETGAVVVLGCLLYLATGLIYGVLFELFSSYYLPHAGLGARLIVYSMLSLAIWLLNFYGVLIWLQPMLFGGRWIVELIPWWVGAATHLVFGWTMAVVYPLGEENSKIPRQFD